MRVWNLHFWALIAPAVLMAGVLPKAACAQNEVGRAQSSLAAEEKETCTRNLKIIYDAIQAYQYDHKDLPNWLSDLVPDYISDPNVLICPVCRRTGKTEAPPLADPKLACSYVFEFSPVPVGSVLPGGLRHTRREWKRRQMGLVGSAVPIVRCRNHNPVLNLGFNGSVYASPPQWELIFTNRVNPAELGLHSIFGGDDAAEDAPLPVVNSSVSGSTLPAPLMKSQTVDLTGFYNSTLEDPWQGHPGDTLSSLPQGLQSFGGVTFDVRGLVQLQGQSPALAKYPAQIKGIPIHHRCQHLYFLHAASLGGNANEGEQIGSYIVHLPNNPMSLEIPIYYGRSVRNWHPTAHEPEPDKELKVAWTGENAASKRMGKPIRLFVTAWNLAPGVEIDTLDFVSSIKTAAPFLLAISID